MPERPRERLHEAAMLTRAVENVFRKLIRFLVGRISLVRLQEMIRYIYVQEAERRLRAERPGRNVPLTRLALLTGLDTRAVVQVRKRLDEGGERYPQQFLAELTPESAIVEAWSNLVQAGKGASARVLTYGDPEAGFEKLVRSTITGRGITTQSIIERLAASRTIEQDRENRTVRLLADEYSPYLSDDEHSMVNAALSSMSSLISTVEHNLAAAQDDKFFQRQLWTFRLNPSDRQAFRAAMRAMLERHRDEAEAGIEPWEEAEYSRGMVTAGVGFYYFEE